MTPTIFDERVRATTHRSSRVAWWAAALLVTMTVLAPPGAQAQAASKTSTPRTPIEGVINRVTDGDSLWLQPAGKAPIEVRLRDIDAPEMCQAYGTDAKKALEQIALGKTATLTTGTLQLNQPSAGIVTVDGQSISKWMVAEGHAWSTRYKYDRGPLMKQERAAIALRRGLHAGGQAVMPKDFRKSHGPCK